MRKALIITLGVMLLLASFIIPLASALTDSDAVYLIKQYSTFDMKRNCLYNGSQCSYAAVCNLTINYIQGNGSIIYNNTAMTNMGSYHNLTLTAHDNFLAGWYMAIITCEDRGDYGSESFYYRVTTTGDENPQATFIIIGIAFLIILIMGYATKNEYVVFISGMVALITGIYGMIYGFNSAPNDFTYMLSAVVIGIGFIFTIMPAYQLLENNGAAEYEEVEEISSE
jgi:hypothetical protein